MNARQISAAVILATFAIPLSTHGYPITRPSERLQGRIVVIYAPPADDIATMSDKDVTIQDFLAYAIAIKKRLKDELPAVAVIDTDAAAITLPDGVYYIPRYAYGFIFAGPSQHSVIITGVKTPDDVIRLARNYFTSVSPSPDKAAPRTSARAARPVVDAEASDEQRRSAVDDEAAQSTTLREANTAPIGALATSLRNGGRLSSTTGVVTAVDSKSGSIHLRAAESGERELVFGQGERTRYVGFAGIHGDELESLTGLTGLQQVHVGDRVQIFADNAFETERVVLRGRPIPTKPRPTTTGQCFGFSDSGILPFAKQYAISFDPEAVSADELLAWLSDHTLLDHRITIDHLDRPTGTVHATSDWVPGAREPDYGRRYDVVVTVKDREGGAALSMQLRLLTGQFATNGNARELMCNTLKTIVSQARTR